jgi:hypothetical protein
MRLPTRKRFQDMPWQNAWSILQAHERDTRSMYDDATLWHPRGRGYARNQLRQKLKRIERLLHELGLD